MDRLAAKRSCSVRERRISATGPAPRRRRSPGAASGRGSATYSSSPSCDARRCRSRAAARPSAGVVVARQRRREDLAVHAERDVAARDPLQLRRERVVEQEADAERAEDLGLRRAPIAIGTVTTCRMPFGCGSRLTLSRPGERVAHRRLAGGDRRARAATPPTVASTSPARVGHEQQVRR